MRRNFFIFFHLVKHIRKRTIQTGRLFFSSSLRSKLDRLRLKIFTHFVIFSPIHLL